jgi:hypothetical protein
MYRVSHNTWDRDYKNALGYTLLLNRCEIYRMVIEICKNLCTLCSLYCPDQGDIVGREYINFYKFLLPYGISLRDSTINGNVESWEVSHFEVKDYTFRARCVRF